MKTILFFIIIFCCFVPYTFCQTDDRIARNDSSYEVQPSSLGFYNREKAKQDIEKKELKFIYWGNIVMLPKHFNSYTKKYDLTILVAAECCKKEPENITKYNEYIQKYIDEKYGTGTFKNILSGLVEEFMKEVAAKTDSLKAN